MNFQDRLTALHVRPVKGYPAVKTTGPQQGGVENIGAVGRSDDNNICIGIKAVHFDKHLVEGLLAFIMRAAQPRAALPSHSINFIHKDDAR